MISDKLRKQKERREAMISASIIPQEEKDVLIDLLNTSLEGTNGLSDKEKLQNISETNFGLVCLFCSHLVEQGTESAKSWKTVLLKCKREIMWVLFAFFGLLFFHPEIAELLKGITH